MKTKFLLFLLFAFGLQKVSAQTVVDIIVNSPDHNTLEAAVTVAGLVPTLQGEGPFTIFAPTDAAFAALPAGTVEALLADPQGALTQILLYHAVGAKALSTSLSNGQFVKTINGKSVSVKIDAGKVFINNAQVTVADVLADNGVVHVIDAVILPPKTVVDIAINSPIHKTLVAAVSAAGLVPTLQGGGPFTIFAPTDAAFAALPAGTVEALLADPQGALTQILLYHAVGAKALSTSLSNGSLLTINGKSVTVKIDAGKVFINNAQVTVVDLLADNGVVHVIDAVLLPPTATNEIPTSSTEVLVSPNPFSDRFNIDYAKVSKLNIDVELYDAAGNLLTKIKDSNGNIQTEIPNGIYFVKIYNKDFSTVKKLIKSN